MDTYVISDLHYGHKNICTYRPEFKTMEEHDETITEGIVSTVGKKDVLWLLGDCFFTLESIKHFDRIKETGVTVNFIPGNHDTDTRTRVNIFKALVKMDAFDKVGSMFRKGRFWLTHAPIHPQELYGSVSVHGHVHRKTVPSTDFINVSAENVRFLPVSLNKLKDMEYRKEVLVHYGQYEHECSDFPNGRDGSCLVCDRGRN